MAHRQQAPNETLAADLARIGGEFGPGRQGIQERGIDQEQDAVFQGDQGVFAVAGQDGPVTRVAQGERGPRRLYAHLPGEDGHTLRGLARGQVERMDAIKAHFARWDSAAAPTAGDLALKEKRLTELGKELALLETQARHARGDYFPERHRIEAKDEAPVTAPTQAVRYIAYPKAMHRLAARLVATPEEVAAWVFWGPENSGLAAYVNANELDPPPRFHFGFGGDSDYVSSLMGSWFSEDEIALFEPAERYITGEALIQRWKDMPGIQAEAFILAKIRESRLQDIHPMFGGTRGTFQEHDDFPPLTSGLVMVSQVEQVEAEDFAEPVDRGPTSTPIEQPINDP